MRLAQLLRQIAYEARVVRPERGAPGPARGGRRARRTEGRRGGLAGFHVHDPLLRNPRLGRSEAARGGGPPPLGRAGAARTRGQSAEAGLAHLRLQPAPRFDFGARSRDYGSSHASIGDLPHWFSSFLEFSRRDRGVGPTRGASRTGGARGRAAVLWKVRSIRDELEAAAHRIAAVVYWDEGWAGCRRAMWLQTRRDAQAGEVARGEVDPEPTEGGNPGACARTEGAVRPHQGVRAGVSDGRCSNRKARPSPWSSSRRAEAMAERLGRELAASDADSERCLLQVFAGGPGLSWSFARGYASGVKDLDAAWLSLVTLFAETGQTGNGLQVLGGFLAAALERCPARASAWLDAAVTGAPLAPWLPCLQTKVGLDRAGRARVLRWLGSARRRPETTRISPSAAAAGFQ